MSKYVNIDFILNETDEFTYENYVLHSLSGNSVPIIDICFCRECTERDDDWCMYFGKTINSDDYCSYGEKESE